MDDLRGQVARMMWWAAAVYYPAGALALLALGSAVADRAGVYGESADSVLAALAVAAAVATLICWVIALWQIFWAGQMAFGAWSGVVYTGLAAVLFLWPGMYVIPHMVRLDIHRLRGTESPDGCTDAEPDGVLSTGFLDRPGGVERGAGPEDPVADHQ